MDLLNVNLMLDIVSIILSFFWYIFCKPFRFRLISLRIPVFSLILVLYTMHVSSAKSKTAPTIGRDMINARFGSSVETTGGGGGGISHEE